MIEESLEIVVYDACVLYPYTLRDTLISLARMRKFQAQWTTKINDEWIRNLLENNPSIKSERLQRTCELMVMAVPDAMIEGYEHIIETLVLPDPDDRHVLAAAIHAEANKIITSNIKHFPTRIVSEWDIEVCRPDAFVAGLIKDYPVEVLKELKKQRERLQNPPQSIDEFLESLSKVGLEISVKMLRKNAELL